jgi:hypothetical protein
VSTCPSSETVAELIPFSSTARRRLSPADPLKQGPLSRGIASVAVYDFDSEDETSFTAPPAAEDNGLGVEGLVQ